MARKLKPRSAAYTWKQRPEPKWTDAYIQSRLPASHRLDRAESLCPTISTIERAVDGEAVARAIITAWQPSFTIVREVAR